MIKQLHFITALFVFLSVHFIDAQTFPQELQEKLENYSSIGKEVVYLHLNKSLFLHGEQLGFTAYVLRKKNSRPSIPTTNLYVQIRDANQDIVIEELLLVEDGIATGVFNIEPKYLPGTYTVTAFTNWMRNFDEQNYFTETIRILESNLDNPVKDIDLAGDIDVQFLPESGHLVNDIINHIGIIAKDEYGYGLPNAKVIVSDSSGMVVGNVELNQFGIEKFSFIPDINEKYTAVISHKGKEYPVNFNARVEGEGIILSAVKRHSKLRLNLSTNTKSYTKIRDKPFVLIIKGRSTTQNHSVKFNEETSIPLEFDLWNLETGMNILTLFDENNLPIAERLFFNYAGLPMEGIQKSEILKHQGDSLKVRFSFEEMKERNMSVSILPQNTISYKRNHNILSYNLLQPYVMSPIEDGGWYFEDITDRKKYELDNLLITQGWSSYDWGDIFKEGIALEHKFEKNIELKARVNNKKLTRNHLRFLIHATSHSSLLFVDVPKDTDEFSFNRFIPVEGDKLNISRVKNNDDLVPADVQIESFPNHIPNFPVKQDGLDPKVQLTKVKGKTFNSVFVDEFLEDAEDLGEVLITAIRYKDKERERKLGNHSYGHVFVLTETDILSFHTLADFLRSKNFLVTEEMGTFIIGTQIQSTNDDDVPDPAGSMAIYLDGSYISNHSMFYNYPLTLVDYIEINRRGIGGGIKDAKGSIKIHTDHTGKHMRSKDYNRIQEFEIPLAYARKKMYYTPQYENASDSFFQQYGVIDWKPHLRSRNGEDVVFQIKRPEVDFKMIIEGIAEDGTLIHEITTFKVAE